MSEITNPFLEVCERLDRIEKLLTEKPAIIPEEKPDRISLDMACELLGTPGNPISRQYVYQLTHKREIPFQKFGGRLVFSRKEILAWRDAHAVSKIYEPVFDAISASAQKKFRQ